MNNLRRNSDEYEDWWYWKNDKYWYLMGFCVMRSWVWTNWECDFDGRLLFITTPWVYFVAVEKYEGKWYE
jgi:hypothetical protein